MIAQVEPYQGRIQIRHRFSLCLLAEVRGETLQRAVFRDWDFVEADLAGCDLSGADLSRTSLAAADLRGANLRDTKLRGANLTGALLQNAQLEGAEYDEFTVWPAGFDPAARGAKKIVVEKEPEPQPRPWWKFWS